jgi:hypothetical protein
MKVTQARVQWQALENLVNSLWGSVKTEFYDQMNNAFFLTATQGFQPFITEGCYRELLYLPSLPNTPFVERISTDCKSIGKSKKKSTQEKSYIIQLPNLLWHYVMFDRLCGLVVRVLGYRSGGPGSIPGTTKKKKSSGSGTGSTQPREYN